GESVFQAGSIDGDLGTLTIDAAGNWSYAADNSQSAIQSLSEGKTLTDTFTVTSADGTEQTVTITVTGVNDAAVITGDVSGSVTEDVDAINDVLMITGTLAVTDIDSGEYFQEGDFDGDYGILQISETGEWVYAADNSQSAIQSLEEGETLTDTFTVKSADGTEQTITITIKGVNDAAVITGDVSGSVTEDVDAMNGVLMITGTLAVTDIDSGEYFQEGDFDGDYGILQISETGEWVYAADNSQSAIQSLEEGETLTDTFTVKSADGTEQTVTITVTGVNDAAVITGDVTGTVTEDVDAMNGVLMITGTLAVTDIDSGEYFQEGDFDGDYGILQISETGEWVYAADNSQPAIQSLSEGETLTDTFTVKSADGTEQTVTITVTGVNDAAVITGDVSGSVTEDVDAMNGVLMITGTLAVTDIDSGEYFQEGDFDGDYGILQISETGEWVYAADNSQSAIQSLSEGETLTDTFTVKSADGTQQTITVTITGVNDVAVIAGDVSGSVTEDANVNAGLLTATGKLSVTDADAGEEYFQAGSIDGNLGTLTIDAAGNWTYVAENGQLAIQSLGEGETLTDTITVKSVDGTEQTITITFTGVNDAAVITGDVSGSVTEDVDAINDVLMITGTLAVTDIDSGEYFQEGDFDGDYGILQISETGEWVYAADNSQPAIQSLGEGETLTDTFTVKSADGTEQTVTITVTGVNDAAVITGDVSGSVTEDVDAMNGVLMITGTLAVTDIDSGEYFQVGDFDGDYGILQISETGEWVYAADNSQPAIQSLGEGETLTDTFTVKSVDGTEQTITITFTGVNDAAVITGDVSGSVTEDVDAINDVLMITGTLAVTDVDSGEYFQVGDFDGDYGILQISETGEWVYAADNSQPAIQSLGEGETLTDTFTVKSADGTEQIITITIKGTSDAPDAVITGDVSGFVTEDEASILTTTGKLSVSDPDAGQSFFLAESKAGAYGTLSIGAAGNWTYTADNSQSAIQSLGAGQTLTDTITVTSADGTEQTITVTITGVNDVAVISGTVTGSVTEDAASILTSTGKLNVTDVDAGQSFFQAETLKGVYGTLSIDADGKWTYTADNSQTAIQKLSAGQSLTETFTILTADGTEQKITVTIHGVDDNGNAVITGDISGSVTEDASTILTTTGKLDVSDPDAGQSFFHAESKVGIYGILIIDADGNWRYEADNSQSAIQQLNTGESLTETFTVRSADGT
ncbi:MAG: VCBS domain-containing protein, partial [Desulfuromonadaceae bacterium]|nr:VCBS domain-containing protein [Desulfuromonadaceae bacterium]